MRLSCLVALKIWKLKLCLTCGWITLVNDSHKDNNLKEILAFVHFISLLNNQSKTDRKSWASIVDSDQPSYPVRVWSIHAGR